MQLRPVDILCLARNDLLPTPLRWNYRSVTLWFSSLHLQSTARKTSLVSLFPTTHFRPLDGSTGTRHGSPSMLTTETLIPREWYEYHPHRADYRAKRA
jgi:hypothetical protein